MSNWPARTARLSVSTRREFGEEVEFQSGKTDSVPVTGIWRDSEAEMPKGVSATLWAPESSFTALPQKNDVVRRGDFEYRVVDPDNGSSGYKRTGDGGILIFLKAYKRNADA